MLRLKVPSEYRIPPHWHPAYENVTVISGEANIGMGLVFDKTKGHKIPAGGFGYLAPQMHHFFWANGETVIQLHGMGPWQLYYINPGRRPAEVGGQEVDAGSRANQSGLSKLSSRLPGVSIKNRTDLLPAMRSIKEPRELEYMERDRGHRRRPPGGRALDPCGRGGELETTVPYGPLPPSADME